jgi:phenylacetic acid degradation operon negative regulatory protein
MTQVHTSPDVTPMPRHQHLIVTLYGLYVRDQDASLAVADLITLLGDLGVEPAGVRSSVSRLKKRGVLVSLRSGGSAAYRLAPELTDVFVSGDKRIFALRRAEKEDGWLLTSFSIPEAQRNLRHKLRTILTRVGCGQVSPGLWIAPGSAADEIEGQLDRAGLMEYVDLFTADHLNEENIRDKVAQWWDLPSLEFLYSEFIEHYEPVLHRWSNVLDDDSGLSTHPQQAFADYVPMITQWRRLPYMDPGLPKEYLPGNWHGFAAHELFMRLHTLLGPLAQHHVHSVVQPRSMPR